MAGPGQSPGLPCLLQLPAAPAPHLMSQTARQRRQWLEFWKEGSPRSCQEYCCSAARRWDIREGTEEPRYTVLAAPNSLEIRQYGPRIAAETAIAGDDQSAALNEGFRRLAGYIFGANRAKTKIEMTVPVAQQKSETIAMTAPVGQARGADGKWVVRFFMPAEWTMETLPVPENPAVALVQVPGETMAVLRFTGLRGEVHHCRPAERNCCNAWSRPPGSRWANRSPGSTTRPGPSPSCAATRWPCRWRRAERPVGRRGRSKARSGRAPDCASPPFDRLRLALGGDRTAFAAWDDRADASPGWPRRRRTACAPHRAVCPRVPASAPARRCSACSAASRAARSASSVAAMATRSASAWRAPSSASRPVISACANCVCSRLMADCASARARSARCRAACSAASAASAFARRLTGGAAFAAGRCADPTPVPGWARTTVTSPSRAKRRRIGA